MPKLYVSAPLSCLDLNQEKDAPRRAIEDFFKLKELNTIANGLALGFISYPIIKLL